MGAVIAPVALIAEFPGLRPKESKIVEKLRQVGQSRYEFERAMVDADNGL